MKNKKIIKTVKKIIKKCTNTNKKIYINMSLRKDLNADSLDLVEIIMNLEDKFKIEFLSKESEKIDKIYKLINIINKKLIKKEKK